MTIARDRVSFKEAIASASVYGRYLLAQKNGKQATTFFWGVLRHQLERGRLDPHLDAAYLKLANSAIQGGIDKVTCGTASGTVSVTFSFGSPAIRDRCLTIATAYLISMADTVRVLLIANQLHDGHTADFPPPPGTGIFYARSNNGSSSGNTPLASIRAKNEWTKDTGDLTAQPTFATVEGAVPIRPTQHDTPHDAPRTQLCEETRQWKLFKPMRANSTMTSQRLMEIRLLGGAYEVMDASELAQHGLSNPAAETNDDMQPANSSRQAQDAFAMIMFAAADRMLEDAA